MKKLHFKEKLKGKAGKLFIILFMLGLGSMSFSSCETEDLDFLDPFELSFADEFDPIVPPTIPDPPLVINNPVPSQVVIPGRVGNIIPALDAANTKPEVDKELEPVTPATNDFVEQSNPIVINTLATLTDNLSENTLNDLRTGTTTLNQDAQNLFATAEAFSSLAEFLPTFTAGNAGGRLKFDGDNIESKLIAVADNLRISDLVGPCREAANEAYQAQLAILNQTRTTNLNTINTNATTREAGIATRLAQRNARALADYNSRWTFILNLNSTYQRLFAAGLLDRNQRYYISLFIYCLVDLNIRSYNFDLQINTFLRNQELFDSNNIKIQATNALTTWYNGERAKLDAELARLLAGCHNQGTGN